MALVLRVLVAGDCSISEGETRVCEGGSFTIGRGAENDWVVNDPQRHLSKQHCRIELRGQTYFVTDTSTNGVYVGGAASPLGRGNSQPVNDGDVINLGPCTLRLEISDQPTASAPPMAAMNGAGRVAGIGHSLSGTGMSGATMADPEMDYGLEGLNSGRTGYVPSLTQVLAGDRVAEMQLTDMLGEGEAEVEAPFGGALAPSLAAHSGTGAYFEAPEVKHPVIPMDWQAEGVDGAGAQDELESVSAAAQVMAEAFAGTRNGQATARMASPAVSNPAPVGPVNGAGATILPINPAAAPMRPQPVAAPVTPVPPVSPALAPVVGLGTMNPAALATPAMAPVAHPVAQPVPVAPPQPAAPVAPIAQAQTQSATATQNSGPQNPGPQIPDDVFEAFLAGVGLPLDAVDASDAPALMHKMGVALREAVNGLRELLELRAFLKSEFRIEHTLLRAKENNPLKFSANLDGTLSVLIGRRVMGFMDAPEAIRESLRDIKAHEVALIAGMKTVVGDVLEQLSPETIKNDVSASMLPQVHKARCWERYEQVHQRMMGEQSSGPPLGSKFSSAYTQQFRSL
ncbi:type VI secretion system-associated FHA domain protein TagH [Nitrospirillum sp. BR 11163]|uniref:type VI secretion system-associated FHA domain protein TagH n=1 Tax=Nitrospirillum sp. BR 11163 TaxID=3104323 RepID=UPI002AFF3B6F|nr:type VI secretion system-associated FHA domain protein TagH [Nitrospirillum sp. BR 11163]MEA1673580.1 type VI secretion system-associated FHA domain protein TagH [Nitrospirillum sp. BR 11163]